MTVVKEGAPAAAHATIGMGARRRASAMNGKTGEAALPLGAPKTVAGLAAMARAMEQEAAERYESLADEMTREGNDALAELFRGLAAEERDHAARIGRWTGAADEVAPLPELRGHAPEAPDGEATAEAGGTLLMTPHRALDLAVRGEERAFAFFTQIAAAATDRAVQEKAEALAREELEHIARLRLARRRAWRTQSDAKTAEAHAVHSLAALLQRAAAIEQAAARRYNEGAETLTALGDEKAALLFRTLAEEAHALAMEIAARTGDTGSRAPHPPPGTPDRGAETSSGLLIAALAGTEDAFTFYAGVAERSGDAEAIAEAQRLAERALERLRRIGARLAELREEAEAP